MTYYQKGIIAMRHNTLLRKAAAVAVSAILAATAVPVTSFAAIDMDGFPSGYTYPTEMRGLTAFQMVSDMGAGWNLGNSLESDYNETYWGNPKTTFAMIEGIAEKGFTTLRVPVRWDDNYSNPSTYTVNESYMDRVETVVNYGLANDMYVILNVHHNDLQHNVPNTEAISAELSAVWTQIGNRFKNYGDKLIFEVNNEPRSNDDWTGNAEYYECVNQCNEAARAAIRATGGNNTERLVMLPTYCASGDAAKAAAWTKNSNDDMIAASIHAYLPFGFAFSDDTENGAHSNWLDTDLQELEYFFERMDKYFISKGVPVVIGEFGATNKNNTSEREKWAEAYISLARQFPEQDIPCVVWDNHYVDTNNPGTEQFKLYDRNSRTFIYDGIAEAITSGYNGNPDYKTASAGDIVISTSPISMSNWSNSAIGGDYVMNLKAGESIKAEYTGDAPIIVLQSWSGGGGWVKVYPDSASNGVATFTYETLLREYGGSFSLLNQAYISATEGSTTVTRIYIPQSAAHTHNYNGTEKVTLAATATTYGRKTVACSVSGCDAEKVVLVEKSAAEEPVAPSAPANLKAVAGEGKVTLTWDAVDGAEQYKIRRHNGTSWSDYQSVTTNSYVDTNVTNGTTYKYSVYAIADGLTSQASATVSATPRSANVTGVKATASAGKVVLTWDAVTGATKYKVRRNDGSGWVDYKVVSTNSLTDTNVVNGTSYRYAVYAYVNGKYGAASATVSAKPMVSAVTGVKATAAEGKVTLTWDALTGATKYKVRRNDGSGWVDYKVVSTNSLTDTNVVNGTSYRYAVYAYVSGKYGSASAVVSAKPMETTVKNVKAYVDGDQIVISWTALSGATKYRIRRDDGSGWTNYKDLTAASYTDTAVEKDKVYRYSVYAYVNGKWGAASAIVSARPSDTIVSNLTATAENAKVTLSWTALSDATKYRIRRNDGSGWVNYKDQTATTFTDTDVTNGTTYRYAVYAYIGGKWKGASFTVSAKPVG